MWVIGVRRLGYLGKDSHSLEGGTGVFEELGVCGDGLPDHVFEVGVAVRIALFDDPYVDQGAADAVELCFLAGQAFRFSAWLRWLGLVRGAFSYQQNGRIPSAAL